MERMNQDQQNKLLEDQVKPEKKTPGAAILEKETKGLFKPKGVRKELKDQDPKEEDLESLSKSHFNKE